MRLHDVRVCQLGACRGMTGWAVREKPTARSVFKMAASGNGNNDTLERARTMYPVTSSLSFFECLMRPSSGSASATATPTYHTLNLLASTPVSPRYTARQPFGPCFWNLCSRVLRKYGSELTVEARGYRTSNQCGTSFSPGKNERRNEWTKKERKEERNQIQEFYVWKPLYDYEARRRLRINRLPGVSLMST